MDIFNLKQRAWDEIDANREQIFSIGHTVLKNPEMGFQEWKTAELVKDVFRGLKIPYEENLALTGVKGTVQTQPNGPTICLIGEMDAITCASHPFADPSTGAAHACGHHAQIAFLLGCAIGLAPVLRHLEGNLVFLAVPAEEFADLDYRRTLAAEGKIRFYSGKQELFRIGAFDGADLVMMTHAQGETPGKGVFLEGSSLGFLSKTIRFSGKAAHAGGAPHEGINALNAASIAMMCINAQRETFRDADSIRVHPIITKGGELVNVVPEEVIMETYVRGNNFGAIQDAADKVDRAVTGAAYAIGATAHISNLPGYLPLKQDRMLSKIFEKNTAGFVDADSLHHGIDMVGSSDIGDISHLLPTIQPTFGGFSGSAHSRDFCVADPELAYLYPAKMMAGTVIDLLANHAEKARQVKEQFRPVLTKKAYLERLESAYAQNTDKR